MFHPFKVIAIKLNTTSAAANPVLEAIGPLLSGDGTKCMFDRHNQMVEVSVLVALDLVLQPGEEEKVCRGKVRGVGWVLEGVPVVLLQIPLHKIAAVCRGIIHVDSVFIHTLVPLQILMEVRTRCIRGRKTCLVIVILLKYSQWTRPLESKKGMSMTFWAVGVSLRTTCPWFSSFCSHSMFWNLGLGSWR